MSGDGKPVSASRVTVSQLMGTQDTNGHGNVHGGVIMRLADEAGALASMRHAQAPTVTIAIDSMTFLEPIYVGNYVQFNAEVTYVGRTSMEVRVEVVKENPLTGERQLSNMAYIVYVALDGHGQPTPVPRLIYETPEQEERAKLAAERQAYRKQQRAKEQN